MVYFKRLITSWSVSLEAFKMYYVMRASAPSLHRESTDSLIYTIIYKSLHKNSFRNFYVTKFFAI